MYQFMNEQNNLMDLWLWENIKSQTESLEHWVKAKIFSALIPTEWVGDGLVGSGGGGMQGKKSTLSPALRLGKLGTHRLASFIGATNILIFQQWTLQSNTPSLLWKNSEKYFKGKIYKFISYKFKDFSFQEKITNCSHRYVSYHKIFNLRESADQNIARGAVEHGYLVLNLSCLIGDKFCLWTGATCIGCQFGHQMSPFALLCCPIDFISW